MRVTWPNICGAVTVLVIALSCSHMRSTIQAQDAAQAAKELPVIADEPKQIDPAQFIEPKLTATTTIRFEDATLDDVAAWLRQQTGWNVVIDAKSFEETGVLTIDPIEESIQDLPVYLLLDRLSRYGVIWRADNSMITLLRAGDKRGIVTAQFHVGDLLDKKVRADDLLECVQSIDKQNWATGDGGATLLGDVLFVRQFSQTNRRIACLLAALRSPSRRALIDDPATNTGLRQALAKPVTVDIKQKNVAVVASELAKLAGVEIRIDRPGLKGNRTTERTPINLDVNDQKLRVALDLLTEQHGLGWHIQSGVIWITSKEVVEAQGLTAVYDVRDLSRDFDESMALENAVEQQSGSDAWEGIGSIQFALPGVMVVNQTEARHDDILQLLEAYRTALKNSKPRVNEETDPEKVITQYYRMPTPVAQQLVEELPNIVGSGQWKADNAPQQPGTIRILSSWDQIVQAKQVAKESAADRTPPISVPYSVLVITQRRKLHKEISEVLHKIEHGDLPAGTAIGGMGGMGGGMGGSFGGGMFNVQDR